MMDAIERMAIEISELKQIVKKLAEHFESVQK